MHYLKVICQTESEALAVYKRLALYFGRRVTRPLPHAPQGCVCVVTPLASVDVARSCARVALTLNELGPSLLKGVVFEEME